MNTKNLDAIKRMVTRLRSIRETEFLFMDTAVRINTAAELLKEVVDAYDAHTPAQDAEEVRTD